MKAPPTKPFLPLRLSINEDWLAVLISLLLVLLAGLGILGPHGIKVIF